MTRFQRSSIHQEIHSVRESSVTIQNRPVTLVDNPEARDYRPISDNIKDIAIWLTLKYQAQKLLAGIIYLEHTLSTRATGCLAADLGSYVGLVYPDSFYNITLVTTVWDRWKDTLIGDEPDRELRDTSWNDFIKKGSLNARYSYDRESALEILNRIIARRRNVSINVAAQPVPKEIIDQEIARLEEVQRRHSSYLTWIKGKQAENKTRAQVHVSSLLEGQMGLKAMEDVRQEQPFLKRSSPTLDSNSYTRMSVEELPDSEVAYNRKVDESRKTRQPNKELVASLLIPLYLTALLLFLLLNHVLFLLHHPYKSHQLLTRPIKRLLRPPLRETCSRIEWICVSNFCHEHNQLF